MMTAYGSIPVAVEAVKLGAFDFLTKPFRNEDLFPLLARIERNRESVEAQTYPRIRHLVSYDDEESRKYV